MNVEEEVVVVVSLGSMKKKSQKDIFGEVVHVVRWGATRSAIKKNTRKMKI